MAARRRSTATNATMESTLIANANGTGDIVYSHVQLPTVGAMSVCHQP